MEGATTSCRVIKLGGSLLRRTEGFAQVRTWWRRQVTQPSVFVVGGGELADQVRVLQRRRGVTELGAHRQAIRAMSVLAWSVRHCEPAWEYTDDWRVLQAWLDAGSDRRGSAIVFDPAAWLTDTKGNGAESRLPVGWHVTSDSIAAEVACRLQASELVLVKSTLPRTDDPLSASREGYVDAYFPRAAGRLTMIRCVDLPGHREQIWRPPFTPPSITTTIDPWDAETVP